MMNGIRGVNVCGYLRDESGLGSAARGYLRALRRLDIPISLCDLSDLTVNRSQDQSVTTFDADHPYDVNLVCINADQHFAALARLGEDFFRGRYNIGVWTWELPHFPPKWCDRFPYYDELWVGSSFIGNTLAAVSPVPVVRIPPVLTGAAEGSRANGRRRLEAAEDDFVFLFIFDFHSYFQRKNPLALIDAFKKAFTPSDRVRLVIKCVNPNFSPHHFAAMQAWGVGYPISIHTGYWTGEEMRDLMAACDAYVSLHRSEGIGLTLSDAMALGKPVIGTGWSGNTDFMNVSNSFPVRYELVELAENIGPYRAGEIWAEPSIDHAAELMRWVRERPEEAHARGEAARREIETNYSEQKVASLICERLGVIAGRHQFAAVRQDLAQGRITPPHVRYRQLLASIREVVETQLPPQATVVVVSKGDGDLLKLPCREAWHFPQTGQGEYTGHHPANSATAIVQLEALREQGGQFLLLPNPSLWWLDHYVEFRQHLEGRYRLVVDQKDVCLIFALDDSFAGQPHAVLSAPASSLSPVCN